MSMILKPSPFNVSWKATGDIGYVVKEALPAVHDALNKKKIVSINFDI